MGSSGDKATGCTGGPAPGASALLQRGLQLFPGVTSGGIYSCRKARVGSSWSLHAEGRAVDFMVRDRTLGDRLAAWATRIPGVQEVIWNDQSWDPATKTWRPYVDRSGRPYADDTIGHRDHVHVGLNRAAAGGLTGATLEGIHSVQGVAGNIGAGIAGLGGDLVEAAVEPFIDKLRQLTVTGLIVLGGMGLLVAGGYRAVTGQSLAKRTARNAGDAALLVATKGKGGAAAGGAAKTATKPRRAS